MKPSATSHLTPFAGGSGRWRRVLAWTAVLAALAATFTAYLQPDLVVDLANRLWSCFG
jgi:hypothetical protein